MHAWQYLSDIGVGIGQRNLVPALYGVTFHSHTDVGEERIVEVDHHHAQHAGLPAGKRAGVQVRTVLQLLDGAEHPGPRGTLHVRVVVQDARNRGAPNTGLLCDIPQIHSANAIQFQISLSRSRIPTGSGARTPACRVGTLADARCHRALRRRVETAPASNDPALLYS